MDDSKPKYKNSSDTPVFKKSRNLFALNFARNTCAETMILCEGYMDVIALHAAGFTNAVATLGTAITSEQARMMSRYTKNVVISYDADEAGQKAAMRAIGMLSEVGLNVTVLRVPGSKDPDEYIKTYGADKFRDILSNTKSKFEYNMENILAKYDINLAQDKVRAVHDLEKLISETNSTAEREIYIRIVAQKFELDARSIKADVDKLLSKAIRQARRQEADKMKQSSAGYSDTVNPDYIKAPAVAKNEENVLGLLLIYPEHRKTALSGGLISENDFFTDLGKRVFLAIKKSYDDGTDGIFDFNEQFSEEEVGRIMRMKLARMQLSDNGSAVLSGAIDSLKNAVRKKNSESTASFDALNALLNIKRGNGNT
jgi:DNA primase